MTDSLGGARGANAPDSGSDIAVVTQVVLNERQGRDRGWWDLMRDLYWPDSRVKLSWYDGPGAGFIDGSAAMAERGSVALHHLYSPSYAILAWNLARSGGSPTDDELGDDRPQDVEAFYVDVWN
jgi:hypothetical protein